jgi:phospholipase C
LVAIVAVAALAILTGAVGIASGVPPPQSGGRAGTGRDPAASGIHKIQHVVIIVQENRSFDSYFGTYPGADGIPMKNGVPTVCVPDPRAHQCVKPYHDRADVNGGGSHGVADALADIHGGKMDGFIAIAEKYPRTCVGSSPLCAASAPPDVMGYHDGRDLPNYWAYARTFVLQDHMFQPNASWSLPAHLYLLSAWAATCRTPGVPASCTNNNNQVDNLLGVKPGQAVRRPNYAWTDLTYLLHKYNVSWKYYVANGTGPACAGSGTTCIARPERGTPTHWNPLPFFSDVRQNNQQGNTQTLDHFYADVKAGHLPAVCWIVPNAVNSEHPAARLSVGQTYVTHLINNIMKSPTWSSTAIFLVWDDWGGFYDHMVPPKVDQNGYGLRVPGLVISPYAKKGYIDHQILSFDAYLKFIEDDFLGGQRLDPQTDGRPDPRPNVREDQKILGDLTKDFDFNQKPRAPLLLPPQPKTDLVEPPAH